MRNRIQEDGFAFDQNFPMSFFLMQPGANGEPTPRPLGPWNDFVATLQAYAASGQVTKVGLAQPVGAVVAAAKAAEETAPMARAC